MPAKGYRKPGSSDVTTNCVVCNTKFTYRKMPSTQIRVSCSKRCSALIGRHRSYPESTKSGIRTFNCAFCNEPVTRQFRGKTVIAIEAGTYVPYCDKTCSSKHHTQLGKSTFSDRQTRERYLTDKLGDAELAAAKLDDEIERQAASTRGERNAMYGRTHTHETRDQLSRNVKKAYEEGRLTVNWGSSYGKVNEYRGFRLRSMHERHCIEKLERRDGLTLGIDLHYEHPDKNVVWYDDEHVKHVYKPDLYDSKNDVVYEAKLECDLTDDEVQRKINASIAQFKTFCVMTQSRIITFRSDHSEIRRV